MQTNLNSADIEAFELEQQAEAERIKKIIAEAEAWRNRWPNHCTACGGWGGASFKETHGFKDGSGETLFDLCQAIEDPATCHRCGEPGLSQEGEGPCKACGWNFDDGEPSA